MKNVLRKSGSVLWHVLMCVCLAAALTFPAAADIIWEPESMFYRTHEEAHQYQGEHPYLTNSDKGYVIAYTTPAADTRSQFYPNGTEITITYLYTADDGTLWGVVGYGNGYVNMSEVSAIYDRTAFEQDHKAEIVPYDGSFGTIEASAEQPVLVWEYPGGRRYDNPYYKAFTSPDFNERIFYTYTDESGKVWGKYCHQFGKHDAWICLSAPYEESAGNYLHLALEPELRHEPLSIHEVPIGERISDASVMIGVLLIGLIVGTAVLMRKLFGKKKA